jgi:pilus assembly protein CpaE
LIDQAPKAAVTQAFRELSVKLLGEPAADGEQAANKNNASKWKKFWPGAKTS